MPSLDDRQRGWAAALISESVPPPDNIVNPTGGAVTKRFNVYRNNVVSSLIEALANTYPAIEGLLGEEYFRALAALFVTQHPPRSPVLLDYGGDFAAFIDDFPPLADFPYLSDVARLEWSWLRSYHAADADVLTPEELAATPQNKLFKAVFTVHPASALIRSDYPVLSMFEINRDDERSDKSLPAEGENVLITRPGLSVEMRRLSGGGDVFIGALMDGDSLGEAAQRCASIETFDLAVHIQGALEAGVFRSVTLKKSKSKQCALSAQGDNG